MPVNNRIANMENEMTEWRRDIHQNPELAYKETRTASKVAELLRSFGVDEVIERIGGTGVVGRISNGKGGSIGLRADMDALPIMETTNCKYSSQNKGVMHACGHDGHTTMLLGAAKYLAETKNFKGDVILVFQPAEEGFAGAKAMIDDGLFERFPIDAIYGMHNFPNLKEGTIAVAPGPRLAAADNFVVDIKGKGSHGAMPSNSVDPVLCASAIVQGLQQLVSRNADPQKTLVVTVASFHSGDANNVIPDNATLTGTVRYYDPIIGKMTRERFKHIVDGISSAHGAVSSTDYMVGYPPTINHEKESEFALEVAKEVAGSLATEKQTPMMGSEDFSYFLQQKPGAYAWIGNGNSAPLHNPKYDFNDSILTVGSSFLVKLAETSLKNN